MNHGERGRKRGTVRPRLGVRAARDLARLTTLAGVLLASCSVYDVGMLDNLLPSDSASTGGFDSGGVVGEGGRSSSVEVPKAGTSAGGSPTPAGSVGSGTAGSVAEGGSASSEGGSASSEGGSASSAGAANAGAPDGGAVTAPTPQELAAGKSVTASSTETGNDASKGNDANALTRWCAKDGTFPQWWRVDLGASHELDSFAVSFEHPERVYSYQIETSSDDVVYVLQATLSGTGALQSATLPPGVSARYVRITVTSAPPFVDAKGTHATWASFYEFSLLGI
jgi:F5/8 type C domain